MGKFKQIEIEFEDNEQSGVYHTMETESINIESTDLVAKFVGALTTKKLHHNLCINAGISVQCAHCGMELTDSISQERSLGPTCSKKGYEEDSKEGIADEMQAFIALAEFPEAAQFLIENYRPKGVRGLL